MIKEIIIQNFESHKKTKLKLHPGINIITGSSDVGKSGSLRSIFWNLENRPTGTLGTSFISDFAKKGDLAKSIIKFNDCKIIRAKNNKAGTGKINIYQIDKEQLTAFGSTVPDEVRQKTKMTDANVQNSQHFPLFLLNETPGSRAKVFSEIAGLKIMDIALANANEKVRDLTKEKNNLKELQKENRKKIKDLKWVVKAKRLFIKAQNLQERINKIDEQEYKLTLQKTHIIELQSELKKIYSILSQEQLLLDLIKIQNEND